MTPPDAPGAPDNPAAPNTAAARTLTTADLEQVYDDLASAVDDAGEHSEKMLAKLALLLAQALGDATRVRACIVAAAQDL